MALDGVNNTQVHKPQRKVAKAVVGTVATAAIVTAGLALGAKSGKFAVTEESSAVAKKILPHLDKAGQAINQFLGNAKTKVTGSKVYQDLAAKAKESGVTDALKDGFKKGQGIVDDVAGKVKNADIKGKAQAGIKKGQSLIETLVAKARGLFNKETAEKVVDAVVDGTV